MGGINLELAVTLVNGVEHFVWIDLPFYSDINSLHFTTLSEMYGYRNDYLGNEFHNALNVIYFFKTQGYNNEIKSNEHDL